MNKAFVRESDDELEDEPELRTQVTGKNYITPQGHRRLMEEFTFLKNTERPQVTQTVSWAAGNGDRSENGDYTYGKKRLREIDRRLRFLAKRIESAEILDPEKTEGTRVKFGATVTVEDEEGTEKTFHIVGVDEMDPAKKKISWQSPIAKALMNKEEGDVALLRAPSGVQELEIREVRYQKIPE